LTSKHDRREVSVEGLRGSRVAIPMSTSMIPGWHRGKTLLDILLTRGHGCRAHIMKFSRFLATGNVVYEDSVALWGVCRY
jgi:hypothetical protein